MLVKSIKPSQAHGTMGQTHLEVAMNTTLVRFTSLFSTMKCPSMLFSDSDQIP